MNLYEDKRVVLTLDAGGTNFVFTAIKGGKEIVEPVRMEPHSDNLEKCLETIIEGFETIKGKIDEEPSAISFAFPGPADYPKGIIGDLPNFPSFRGGVALGEMLKEKFNIPVFINNDGDLFVYGEALGGFLPYVNKRLKEAGSDKVYKNLFGITLGTGFGGGIVRKGELFIGDNSTAGEIWLLRNKLYNTLNAEDGACIRAIRRVYREEAKLDENEIPSPKEIYEIAKGEREGNKEAAIKAYKEMAIVVGDALANAITLIDGLIVIGGGISGAADLFLDDIINEMQSNFILRDGSKIKRLTQKVFNLEKEDSFEQFIKGDEKEIDVPFTNKKIKYDPLSRIGIGVSRLGTSTAVSVGAYAFAINELNKMV